MFYLLSTINKKTPILLSFSAKMFLQRISRLSVNSIKALKASYSTKTVHETVKARQALKPKTEYPTSYPMPVLDKAAQTMLFTEIFRTMWLVLEQMFKPPYTIMYPHEKGTTL